MLSYAHSEVISVNCLICAFQYERGADPVLMLHDENNEVKDVLRLVTFSIIVTIFIFIQIVRFLFDHVWKGNTLLQNKTE